MAYNEDVESKTFSLWYWRDSGVSAYYKFKCMMAPNFPWIIPRVKVKLRYNTQYINTRHWHSLKPQQAARIKWIIGKEVVVMTLRTLLPHQGPSWYQEESWDQVLGNFSQQFSLCGMQRILIEDVFNCFQLTTFAIMTSFLGCSLLEILSQNTMACTKLKWLTKVMKRYTIYKKFQ